MWHLRQFVSATIVSSLVLCGVVGAGAATTASAYCRTGMTTWSSTTNPKVMGVATTFPSAMRTGLAGALAQWNRTGSNLVYSAPNYNANWLIFAFRGNYAYTSLMGSAPGIALPLASGGTHTGGDLYLSDRFTWVNASQDLQAGKADVQTVAVHEIGHFTGLAHPWIGADACSDGTTYTVAEQLSVMTTIPTGTRRTLGTDDVAGVTALY